MKTRILLAALCTTTATLMANTPPSVSIQSIAMRPSTTLMDIVYRVDDPDNSTVKVRALAFSDGIRSFANVVRPVTFVEGTDLNLGDSITTNTNHTLTWNVAADWSIDLGQVKFEVLARDSRGLLPLDWLTIPAAGGNPALTISKNAPTDPQVLDALFWQYAMGDLGQTLENGDLRGNGLSGVFSGVPLADDNNIGGYAAAFVFKQMDLDPGSLDEARHTDNAMRRGPTTGVWSAANREYTGLATIVGWGLNEYDKTLPPRGLVNMTAIAAGSRHSLALNATGLVVGWGHNGQGRASPPAGLANITAIAAGGSHSLALRDDGTVVGWGQNTAGQTSPPAGLENVIAIAAGNTHSLALRSDGTIIGWGVNTSTIDYGQATPPAGLANVVAIAAGLAHSLALKDDGTIVGWGFNNNNQATPPAGLANVIAIAGGSGHSLALKDNGTVVGWGRNVDGEATPPIGLANVTAIAAGDGYSMALKTDGTVVSWGMNGVGQTTIPADLANVTRISAGGDFTLILKAKSL